MRAWRRLVLYSRRWYNWVQGSRDCSEGAKWLQDRYLEPRLHTLRATFWRDAFPRFYDHGNREEHSAQRADLWRTYMVDCELRKHIPHIKHALQGQWSQIWHRWCTSPPMDSATLSVKMKGLNEEEGKSRWPGVSLEMKLKVSIQTK